MIYVKALNIWEGSTAKAIERGQIQLQRGQWLQCGKAEKPCRFVGLTRGGSIWVTHWKGTPEKTRLHFNRAIQAHDKQK